MMIVIIMIMLVIVIIMMIMIMVRYLLRPFPFVNDDDFHDFYDDHHDYHNNTDFQMKSIGMGGFE